MDGLAAARPFGGKFDNRSATMTSATLDPTTA
jgi:hypothetical protein